VVGVGDTLYKPDYCIAPLLRCQFTPATVSVAAQTSTFRRLTHLPLNCEVAYQLVELHNPARSGVQYRKMPAFLTQVSFSGNTMQKNHCGPLSLGVLALTLCLFIHPATKAADEKSTATGSGADVPLRYVIKPARPWYYGRVEKVLENGGVVIVPARRMPVAAELSEGYYLAIPHESPEPSLDGPRVLRAHAVETRKDASALLQLSPTAAPTLKTGDQLTLFRPTGATTDELMRFPDGIVKAEGRARWPMSSVESATCRAISQNNLKSIGLALHQFHDRYGRFPPAALIGPDGKPWHSWRVLVLPFLDQEDLHHEYRWDEPWNGPNNRKLLSRMPEVFSDPIHGMNHSHYTHYVAITGPGMAFSADGHRFDPDRFDLMRLQGRSIDHFTDGTSNTILVGPVSPDRQILWMKPEDIVVGCNLPPFGRPGSFDMSHPTILGNAGLFLLSDGFVLTVPRQIDQSVFMNALTLSGGDLVDLNDLSGAELSPGPTDTPVLRVWRIGDTISARVSDEPVALNSTIGPADDD
jgi:hypothetical protein